MDVDLLTTGQAAGLLGCSRQHVVDLCEARELAHVRIGVHRRLNRRDVEAFALRGPLNDRDKREERRSLWLHCAVAGHLARDPDVVLVLAESNLKHLRNVHPGGVTTRWLDLWQQTIDRGPDAVMRMLTSGSPTAAELRQNSPFAGVLDEDERQFVLRSFVSNWRAARA